MHRRHLTGARAYQGWTSEDRQRVLDYKPRRGS